MYNPKMDMEFYEKHKNEYPVSTDPENPFPDDLTPEEIDLIWEWRAHGSTDAEIRETLYVI